MIQVVQFIQTSFCIICKSLVNTGLTAETQQFPEE